MTDRDAAPAAAEGADALAELIAKGEAMKEAFFTGDDNREAIACMEWDAAVGAARASVATAPTIPELAALRAWLGEHAPPRPPADLARCPSCREYVGTDGACTTARRIRAILAAAPHAGGETFTEAEVRAYAEHLLASGPHAASGRGILAMVRFLTTAHRLAARAAAGGDAAEGTHHRPVVDAAGHELVGDGTP